MVSASNFRAAESPRWYEQILEVIRRVLGGYLYIPLNAGAPTAVPTTRPNQVPLIYDTTNNDLYVYNSGWKKLATISEGNAWTPTDASGASLTLTISATARYTVVGKIVIASFAIVYPATANTNSAKIGGLPFTSNSTLNDAFGGSPAYTDQGTAYAISVLAGATTFEFMTFAGATLTNANLSGKIVRGTFIYERA